MTSTQVSWKKVVYEESNGIIAIRQGFYYDEGDYVRVNGDRTDSLIKKDKIISITTNKQAGPYDRKY